jgi:hypothetical protein
MIFMVIIVALRLALFALFCQEAKKVQSGIIHPILSPNPAGKTPTYRTVVLSQDCHIIIQKKIINLIGRVAWHSSSPF